MSEKKVVEINGVKIEVDLRTATAVETYKVGDPVKVLKKKYSDWAVYPGVIAAFTMFKNLPTITVACLIVDYSEAKIEFINFNADTKEAEFAAATDIDIAYNLGDVIGKMDREIAKKEAELEDLKLKKNFFLKNFQKSFKEVVDEGN